LEKLVMIDGEFVVLDLIMYTTCVRSKYCCYCYWTTCVCVCLFLLSCNCI